MVRRGESLLEKIGDRNMRVFVLGYIAFCLAGRAEIATHARTTNYWEDGRRSFLLHRFSDEVKAKYDSIYLYAREGTRAKLGAGSVEGYTFVWMLHFTSRHAWLSCLTQEIPFVRMGFAWAEYHVF